VDIGANYELALLGRPMLAVILAGGKGTRLRPFTMTIPKPLLPLGDLPVLDVVLRQLAANGFSRVVLTLGHMAPLFTAQFGDGSDYGLSIEYVREGEPLGTAAPLRRIPDLPENFLVMNGDLLTDISYKALFHEHVRQNAAATIGTVSRSETIDYGLIEMTPDGAFLDYKEKPVVCRYVSMGIYVLNRRALSAIPVEGKFDMPELIKALHSAGERVHCFRSEGYWQDIGRFEDYTRASEDFVRDPHRFLPRSRAGAR
jgi:NDP-sugar pyrophosphorylase family protein